MQDSVAACMQFASANCINVAWEACPRSAYWKACACVYLQDAENELSGADTLSQAADTLAAHLSAAGHPAAAAHLSERAINLRSSAKSLRARAAALTYEEEGACRQAADVDVKLDTCTDDLLLAEQIAAQCEALQEAAGNGGTSAGTLSCQDKAARETLAAEDSAAQAGAKRKTATSAGHQVGSSQQPMPPVPLTSLPTLELLLIHRGPEH